MSTANSREQWQNLADRLISQGEIKADAFIGGEYLASVSGERFDCVSPIDGRVLCQVASCDLEDANIAVANARQTFDSGVWSELAPVKRKQVMIRFAELLEQNRDELALLETLDMGKPIRYSGSVDVDGAARAIRWSGEAIDKIYDELAPTAHNEIGMITREPVGVVAAIVPWNFPILMACWKLGPALATGNSVVLKPSEKSPLTAIRMAQIAIEAGIPKGVLNVLPGFGHTVGKALALHMDVDTLVFTGSTKIAKQLMIYAGESNMKRVWLEAGGKSPNIVFNDAPNLKKAAEAAAAAIAFNQGEVCTAGSRLLVEAGVKDELLALIAEEMQAWQPGHPLDPATTCGAVVDKQQLDNILGYIKSGLDEGATLIQGGEQVMAECGGAYVQPTIFSDVNNQMTIAKEEIFGPVLSVITFDGMEQAIEIGNDSIYGLAAGVWTSDISKAHKTARALRSGMVWINHYDGGDMTAPFGGYKQSGNGRDKSLHAFDKYTEIKATWIMLD